MNILGIHTGHDSAAAVFSNGRLVSYCKEERLTRIKSDGRKLLLGCIPEVYQIAGLTAKDMDVVCISRAHIPVKYFKKTHNPLNSFIRRLKGKCLGLFHEMSEQSQYDVTRIIDEEAIKKDLGVRPDTRIYFSNHHYSHNLGSFQFTTWEKDALYLSCDGGGDGAFYSAYSWDGKQLSCLYGGEDETTKKMQNSAASIGLAYSAITKHLGFRGNRHEGKITGLAAFGKPILADDFISTFIVNDDGSIESNFSKIAEWTQWMKDKAVDVSREDLAASIQVATEVVVLKWVNVLLKKFPARYIGLSGGVFSNVRLNQKVAEINDIEDVFVCPPMGDEGLAVGNCTDAIIREQGIAGVKRHDLENVYWAREYTAQDLLDEATAMGLKILKTDDVAGSTSKLLADGWIGAIFSQRMEMGPRALGARSIIAAPIDRDINDSLNKRLERTEFMPFAPYVLNEDAERIFAVNDVNRRACEFMTITTDVHPEYIEKIPAVVHVDNTARPQIIKRTTNPLYYDILKAYRDLTGIPCLVNTSFNAHEEPIINTPKEALRALIDQRVDFLVCEGGLISVSDLTC